MSIAIYSDLDPDVARVADRLVASIEAGDMDAWGALFADDGKSWHSYSGAEMTGRDNAAMLAGMLVAFVDSIKYEDVRRHRIDGGYVQQHELVVIARNGAVFRHPVCVFVYVNDGRVTRMEEYLDSSVGAFRPGQRTIRLSSGSCQTERSA